MMHRLRIEDYEVYVHLGCDIEEQKHSQPVRFELEITYQHQVHGCVTDRLVDATDYVKLTSVIRNTSTQKNYHLIEHLNYEVLQNLKLYLVEQQLKCMLKLTVHKIRVPVDNLHGGVFFTCELEV